MKLLNDFHSKVVGTTFCDGQELLNFIEQGQELKVVPEPDNKYDKNALKVMVSEKDQLGYIPKETAKGLAEDISNGAIIRAFVSEITGKDKTNKGCNIRIEVYK